MTMASWRHVSKPARFFVVHSASMYVVTEFISLTRARLSGFEREIAWVPHCATWVSAFRGLPLQPQVSSLPS